MARAIQIPAAVQSASGAVGPQNPASPGVTASGTGPQMGGRVTYMGHSGIRETAGAAVTIQIRGGGSATGTILEEIVLAANGSVPSVWKGPNGIGDTVGLYINFVSGTGHIEGSVLIG